MKNEAIISKKWSINSEILSEEFKDTDYLLLLLVTALVLFGLLMVYSSSFIFAQERTGDGFAFIKKQFFYAVVGYGALYAAYRIPIRIWRDHAYSIAFGSLVLLCLILVPGIGARVGGAQRWIRVGPLQIQPVEFIKITMIFFAARQLDRKRSDLNRFVPGVLSPFTVPILSILLLLAQPDFGSSVLIAMVVLILMFVAGVRKRFLFGLLGIGGFLAGALIWSSDYRRARLLSFLDPWKDPGGKGFQVIQSLLGFHNGSFLGVGLGNGKEKLFYLPEAHNDFIFAVIGEELGFIGVAALVLVYTMIVYRGLKISLACYRENSDLFGSLLAAGITLMIGLQGFINMIVVMGLLPTKGLTLPFLSYGGSALVANLFAIGILLRLGRVKTQESF